MGRDTHLNECSPLAVIYCTAVRFVENRQQLVKRRQALPEATKE